MCFKILQCLLSTEPKVVLCGFIGMELCADLIWWYFSGGTLKRSSLESSFWTCKETFQVKSSEFSWKPPSQYPEYIHELVSVPATSTACLFSYTYLLSVCFFFFLNILISYTYKRNDIYFRILLHLMSCSLRLMEGLCVGLILGSCCCRTSRCGFNIAFSSV